MSTAKISEAFVPQTVIEKLVHAGDQAGLIDHLAGLNEAQRFAERAGVRKLHKVMNETALWLTPAAAAWRSAPTEQQRNAMHVALYVCGTVQDMVDDWFAFLHRRTALVKLWQRIPRNDIQQYADLAIAGRANAFPVLHALFQAGMIERPVHDNYVLGVLNLSVEQPKPRVLSPELQARMLRDVEPPLWILGVLEQDPDFAHTTLLRLFEVEGNSDLSLANTDKYGKGITSPRDTMHGLFLYLIEQGVFSRALLLDKTLAVLERDWLQFRSGWFSRFHETLAPTAEELGLHRDRYLGLCHSRIPPTVTLALGVLQALMKHEAIAAEDLLSALQPVLTSKVKAQVTTALKLLDTLVAADPGAAEPAAMLAAAGLVCDASDVQKQVLQRLQRWGTGEPVKDVLRQYLPMVAATHRDTIAAMLGEGAANAQEARRAAPAGTVAPATLPQYRGPQYQGPHSPLDSARELASINTLDELIDCLAYVLEQAADLDAFERAVAALVRLAQEARADTKRLNPILKRARKLNHGKGLPRELARLLMAILAGEDMPPLESFAKGQHTARAFLARRTDELAEFAASHPGLLPLAAPTHKGGYIDPAVLVERVAAEHKAGAESGRQEQVLSLLRLAPMSNSTALARARELDQTPYVQALRYALGDDIPVGKEAHLFAAAARIRHPGQDDPELIKRHGDLTPDAGRHATYHFRVTVNKGESWTFHHGHIDSEPSVTTPNPDILASLRHLPPVKDEGNWYRYDHFGGSDEGLMLTGAAILPSDLQAYFAEGARHLSNNLDWSEAQWQNRAYLSTLLEPITALTGMATLCLACGLAGKEPGQTALAGDALLGSWLEGRLHVDALAGTLRHGMTENIFKAARLHKSLLNTSRMHELAPHLVFQLLCGMLCMEQVPKDTAALMDLLLEVKLITGEVVPQATRQHIAAMQLSGKGKTAQKALLGA